MQALIGRCGGDAAPRPLCEGRGVVYVGRRVIRPLSRGSHCGQSGVRKGGNGAFEYQQGSVALLVYCRGGIFSSPRVNPIRFLGRRGIASKDVTSLALASRLWKVRHRRHVLGRPAVGGTRQLLVARGKRRSGRSAWSAVGRKGGHCVTQAVRCHLAKCRRKSAHGRRW